jgi:cytidine diphosphoramidate kinase
VWITGLSGVGKTTVAQHLRERLLDDGINPVMLDGDRIRRALMIESAHTRDERKKLAMTYSKLAQEISSQGHLVIVSTISLFTHVHQWNRDHLERYVEVLLRASKAELLLRDSRGIYSEIELAQGLVVGMGQIAEFPEQPDIVIDNFGINTPTSSALQIREYLTEVGLC